VRHRRSSMLRFLGEATCLSRKDQGDCPVGRGLILSGGLSESELTKVSSEVIVLSLSPSGKHMP